LGVRDWGEGRRGEGRMGEGRRWKIEGRR